MSSLGNSIIDGNLIIGTVHKIAGQGQVIGLASRTGEAGKIGPRWNATLWPRIAAIFAAAEIGCICLEKAFLFFQQAKFCWNMRSLCWQDYTQSQKWLSAHQIVALIEKAWIRTWTVEVREDCFLLSGLPLVNGAKNSSHKKSAGEWQSMSKATPVWWEDAEAVTQLTHCQCCIRFGSWNRDFPANFINCLWLSLKSC